MKKTFKKVCGSVMVLMMFGLNIQIPLAHASMVSTDQMVQKQSFQQERDKVTAFLDRAEVQQQLQGYGVTTEDAQFRVANLSNQEIALLSGKIDQLPAGGDFLGTAVFLFLVLLFTDIFGLTDVFPFVHPLR